uniref:Uncharacterized protein n=1 Tax=Glossina pallidipes TaxID=7398 RepID=A0A1A9ZSI4_GLOPL
MHVCMQLLFIETSTKPQLIVCLVVVDAVVFGCLLLLQSRVHIYCNSVTSGALQMPKHDRMFNILPISLLFCVRFPATRLALDDTEIFYCIYSILEIESNILHKWAQQNPNFDALNVAVTDVAAIVTANVSLLWAKEEALVSAQIMMPTFFPSSCKDTAWLRFSNAYAYGILNRNKISRNAELALHPLPGHGVCTDIGSVCLISPATALDHFIDSPAYGIIAQGTFNHTKANISSSPMHCLYACIGKRDGISRRLISSNEKKKKEKSNNNFDDAVNDVHSLQYLFCVSFMCELCCLLANYRLKLLLSAKCTARKTCNQMSDVEEHIICSREHFAASYQLKSDMRSPVTVVTADTLMFACFSPSGILL